MAAVDDEVVQTVGYKDAFVQLSCPECGEDVVFPFMVELQMTATQGSMQIGAKIFGDQINEQPLFDHKLERHGPDAES